MWVFCLYVCLWTTRVPGANRSWKRMSESLVLELQMLWAAIWMLGIHLGNPDPFPLEEQPVLLTAESISPARILDFLMRNCIINPMKISIWLFRLELCFVFSLLIYTFFKELGNFTSAINIFRINCSYYFVPLRYI